MPIACVAYNCKNSQSVEGIRFHLFPRDIALRNIWIKKIKRKDWVPTKFSHLCSDHFTPDCYEPDLRILKSLNFKKCPRLKKDAIPTIFNYTGKENFGVPLARPAAAKRRRREEVQNAQNYFAALEEMTNTRKVNNDNVTDLEVDEETDNPVPPISTPVPNLTSKYIWVTPHMFTAQRSIGTQTPNWCCPDCSIKQAPEMQDAAMQCNSGDLISDDLTTDSEADDGDCTYCPSASEDTSDSVFSDCDEQVASYSKKVSIAQCQKFIIFLPNLLELFTHCRKCFLPCVPTIKYIKGTMIVMETNCNDGHKVSWYSQPMSGQKPWGNILLSAGILFSGSKPSQALRIFQSFNVATISKRTFSNIQSAFLLPAIEKVWSCQQASLFLERHEKDLQLAGDGRCDSPGFCAKYGSYTLIDAACSKVLHLELIQSNEVKSSVHMEKEGLVRAICLLEDNNLNIQKLVTDRHIQIRSYLKKEKPDISHEFDPWHIAKSVGRKIDTVAKLKPCEELSNWKKSIINHLYWCAASSDGNGDLVVAKWKSIENHIIDRHSGHSELFPNCAHEDIHEPRMWLDNRSKAFGKLKSIVTQPSLLRDLRSISSDTRTSGVEAFHATNILFAQKSTHYSYCVMKGRLTLSILHYNENSKKDQARKKSGEKRWNILFPKYKKGDYIVRQVRNESTYDYVRELLETVETVASGRDTSEERNRKVIPPPLSHTFHKPPRQEAVQRHMSRFTT